MGPHHRRPQLLGGTYKDPLNNISLVHRTPHNHWNTLVGSRDPEGACEKLESLPLPGKPEGTMLVCIFMGGTKSHPGGNSDSPDIDKCVDAWKKLFCRFSFEEAIEQINTIWLDPNYRLEIRQKPV